MDQDSSNRKLCIMFSDVVGSTRLYDTLGDTTAEKYIGECVAMMSKEVSAHSGHVVKTIGDEIMAYFEKADDAYEAARQIQLAAENIKISNGKSIKMRIGMHLGSVIEKDKDIFGDAVNIAARISGISKAGQIMISEDLYLQLDKYNQFACRLFDRAYVKGKEQALNIYQLVWEEQDQTNIITTHGAAINDSKGGLKLDYQGKSAFISNSDGVQAYTVGRDVSCNLAVDSNWASRSHLEIVWRRNKFLLTDHSTNGTTVTLESGESIFLKRESYPLIGKGSFTLGVDRDHIIRFEVLNTD